MYNRCAVANATCKTLCVIKCSKDIYCRYLLFFTLNYVNHVLPCTTFGLNKKHAYTLISLCWFTTVILSVKESDIVISFPITIILFVQNQLTLLNSIGLFPFFYRLIPVCDMIYWQHKPLFFVNFNLHNKLIRFILFQMITN